MRAFGGLSKPLNGPRRRANSDHHQDPSIPPASARLPAAFIHTVIHSSYHPILSCSGRWLAILSDSSHRRRPELVPGTQVHGASATRPAPAWNSILCKRRRWLTMYAVADKKLAAFPKTANFNIAASAASHSPVSPFPEPTCRVSGRSSGQRQKKKIKAQFQTSIVWVDLLFRLELTASLAVDSSL